jgi:hypothetical protein
LLATDAASEGLNLHQHCRLVINLELPWTPVRLEQRIGRVERLGQTRRVHAVHLLAAATSEELSVATFAARVEKVASVLSGLRGSAVTELQVASAVMGDPEPQAVSPGTPPPGLIVGDLRGLAANEASRLENTRLLAPDPSHTAVGARVRARRPPVAVFRRHGTVSNCCCAFHVAFEDADQQPLWETLIGVSCDETPDATGAAAVCSWIELASRRMGPTITAELDRMLASAAASSNTPIALAVDRERAIADALKVRRARLSAELLQPGLFDHRAERTAISQDAVLEEALGRCASRISDLTRSRPPYTCRHRLAFGLIRR